VGIQLGQAVNLRHGRGPVSLQVTDPAFDVRLLLGLTHHAETRLESVVTDQGLIAVVELALAADEQVRHDRLGIVPPQFPRYTSEEGERLDQAVQDGLGAFGRQGNGEGAIGVRPGGDQHGHRPAAVGEIDVDVTEIALQALAWIVVERNKRLRSRASLAQQVLPDALIAAGVSVLVAQAAKDFGHRVSLLARRIFIGADDGVDDRFEGIDDRWHGPALVLLGLGLAEDLPNLASRVMESPAQLTNAELVNAVRLPDACVLVHLDHPPPPVAWFPAGRASWCTSLQEVSEGGPVFDEEFGRRWVRIGRGIPYHFSPVSRPSGS